MSSQDQSLTIYDEEELLPEDVEKMPQEKRFELISFYRNIIHKEGKRLSKSAHRNAIRISRAIRTRAIKSNAYAKPKAKKKAEVAQFSLASLLSEKKKD